MEGTTKRTRPKQIIIRMTETEFSTYQNRLEQSKLTAQKYCLRCLLDNEKINVIENMPDLIRHLKGIGNNLNQIARAVNSGEREPTAAVNELGNGVNELWQLLKQFRVAGRTAKTR